MKRWTPPDIILINGKIVPGGDRFSIAQAVAVRGDRLVAVGPILREELDQVAPANPVFLQFTRSEQHLNSEAIQVLGLETRTEPWTCSTRTT